MSMLTLPYFPLRRARVHEVFGPAAMTFVTIAIAHAQTEALWVREDWVPEEVHPLGLVAFLDPSSMLMARTKTQVDSLAVAEEALREGVMPIVVIEITRPLDLREGRRLQLAAKAGGATGLCIIPEGMGSNAAETRWRAVPVFDPVREDSTPMRWEIIKNKSGTIGAWNVCWNAKTARLDVVSPAGERPGSADARR